MFIYQSYHYDVLSTAYEVLPQKPPQHPNRFPSTQTESQPHPERKRPAGRVSIQAIQCFGMKSSYSVKKKTTTKCSDLLLKLLEKVKGVFPENSRLEKSFLCSWFCIQLNSVEQTYSYLNIFLVLTSIVTAGQWTCRVPGTLVSLLCIKDILLQYPDRGSEVV